MTSVLILIIFYVYAFLSLLLFREQFGRSDGYDTPEDGGSWEGDPLQKTECNNLSECFIMQIHYGLRQGGLLEFTATGGGYDYKELKGEQKGWVWKVAFDLSFWLIITVFMMNIILGIIVDTFSELRGQQVEREGKLKDYCFLSDLHRSQFDQLYAKSNDESHTFAYHTKHNMNMWSYVKFIAYLKHKDPVDYTGPEAYIADLLEDNSAAWIPWNKCINLEEDEEEEDGDAAALRAELDEMKNQMKAIASAMQATKRQ